MTITSLTEGLNKLAEERSRQLAIIDGAESARDAIMDADDGEDAELLEIDRRVALARIAIDRLSRLEAEAFEQLAPLQLEQKQGRWDHAVAQYVQLMRTVHAAMEAYEQAANHLWAYRSPLFEAAGSLGWDDQVPRLPHFMKAAPGGMGMFSAAQYAEEMERFSRLRIGAPSQVNNYPARLARYIEGKLDLHEVAPASGTWGGAGEDPGEHPVLIRLMRPITLGEGEKLKLGDVVKVRAAHARELVMANRATLSDTLTAVAGYRPYAADLPIRELPTPSGVTRVAGV